MSEKVSYRIPLDDLKLEGQQFSSKDDIKSWLQDILLRTKGIHIVIERSDATKIIFRCKNKEKKTKIIESKNKNTKIPIRRHTSCPFKIRANLSTRLRTWTILVMDDRHDHVVDGHGGGNSLPKLQVQQELPSYISQEEQQQQPPPSLSSLGPGMHLSKSNMDKKSKMESTAKNDNKNCSSNTDQSSSVSAFSNRSTDEFRDSPPTSLNLIGEDASTGTDETSTSGNSVSSSISLPKKRKFHSTKGSNRSKKQEVLSAPTLEIPQAACKSISKRDLKKNIDTGKKPQKKSAHDPMQQLSPQQSQLTTKSPRDLLTTGHHGTETSRSYQDQQNGQIDQPKFSPSQVKAQVLPIPKPQSQTQSLYAIQALQNEVRQKIKYYILDNRNITDNQKTAMLDSFVSQLLIEYRNAFSPQFLDSLRQNLYGRENTNGNGVAPGGSNTPVERANFQQSGPITQPPLNKKATLNNWLLSSLGDSSGSGLPSSSIPLSPLLNDNESVYAAAAAAAAVDGADGLPSSSLENMLPAPSINGQTSNGLSYSNQGNGQLSQIQNQGQQLPPINSIQNKIPSSGEISSSGNLNLDSQASTNNMLNSLGTPGTSFGMGGGSGLGVNFGPSNGSTNAPTNGSTKNSGTFSNPANSLSSSSFFGNVATGNGSLMPPLNPAASTLNPSHILKNGVGNNTNGLSNNTNGLTNNLMMSSHSHNSQANNANPSSLTPLSFNPGKNANAHLFMTSNSSQLGAYNNNSNNNNQYLFASPSTGSSNQINGNSDKDQGIMLNNLSNYDSGW